MKRIVVLLSVFFSCLAAVSAQEIYQEADVIRFDKKVHDFGPTFIAIRPFIICF